ncbi:MAG: hypothetical protein MJ240_04630 [Kiritimatiellae bacterium]|nr:hypothetical protein [Kiritimatiellia bacterium]
MNFKRIFYLVLGLVAGTVFADPVTWYVDAANYGKADNDGSSARPFGSLQEANDAAAVSAGDIVKVLPGVYDQGSSTHAQNKDHPSRVVITKKLRFEAEKGTVQVVGRVSTSSIGYGADGMRCLFVAESAAGAEFHGFTFSCGSTSDGSGGNGGNGGGEGGGVCVYGSRFAAGAKTSPAFATAFFVDCVVTNCHGLWSGGARGGTWIRSLFVDNEGKSFGHSAGEAALWNCVIKRSRALQDDRPTVGNSSRVVNCTFYQCGARGTAGNSTVFNSVYSCRTGGSDMYAAAIGVYPESYFTNSYASQASTEHLLFAPALDDYRILSGSSADAGGLTCYLKDEIILPADTEMKDYYGTPIDLSVETCNAGACQVSATPASGNIQIPANYTVGGVKSLSTSYAYSETFPNTLVIAPIQEKHFRFRLGNGDNRFNGGNVFRYVQEDGTLHLGYPPFRGDKVTFTEDTVNTEYWADPSADAAVADGTEAHPFRTLQAAMDYAELNGSGNIVIHALPGDYAEGGKKLYNLMNRVVVPNKPIILRSTGGAAVTTIRGASDPNAPMDYFPGCGPDACRCLVFAEPGGSNRAVQGFTFADGRSGYQDYSSVDDCEYGAGVMCYFETKALQVLDCVFTNCWAVRCGAVMGTWNTRCKFYDCHGFGGVMRQTLLSGCYVDRSCTVGDGPVGGNKNSVLGSETKSYLTTCPGASYAASSDANKWHVSDLGLNGSVAGYHLWGTVEPASAWFSPTDTGAAKGEILAVDPANDDWRLLTGGATLTLGRNPEVGSVDYPRWATNFAANVSSGVDGAKLTVIDGHVVPGCYQKPVDNVTVKAAFGGLAVVGGKVGVNEATEDLSLVVTAAEGASRPCVGMVVNGVTNLFATTPSVAVNAADVNHANGAISVEALYDIHWYVNPQGSDAYTGFTAETPKKTLAALMAMDVLAGDIVHVAAGRYEDKSMAKPDSKGGESLSRVVVPAGVTLVSDEGAQATFIVGAASTAEDRDAFGRGEGAVRCVYLENGAKVKGFTLMGGRTKCGDFNTYQASCGWMGAAAYSALTVRGDVLNTTIEDCVITDCVALVGTAYGVGLKRCRMSHCRAQRGSATERCGLNNVIIDDMDSDGTSGLCVNNYYELVNCTIGRNIRRSDGNAGGALWRQWGADYGVTNTVVLGVVNESTITSACNCAFANVPSKGTFVNCRKVTAAQCAFDADFRPDRATSVLIDQGVVVDGMSKTDAYGGQRIYNGVVDIGAVEADWRTQYAADLGARSGSVTNVSAGVQETASGGVRVPEGEALMGTLTTSKAGSARYRVIFALAAESVATVTVNGVSTTYTAPGTIEHLFTSAEALNEIALACTAGSAELLRWGRAAGLTVSVR